MGSFVAIRGASTSGGVGGRVLALRVGSETEFFGRARLLPSRALHKGRLGRSRALPIQARTLRIAGRLRLDATLPQRIQDAEQRAIAGDLITTHPLTGQARIDDRARHRSLLAREMRLQQFLQPTLLDGDQLQQRRPRRPGILRVRDRSPPLIHPRQKLRLRRRIHPIGDRDEFGRPHRIDRDATHVDRQHPIVVDQVDRTMAEEPDRPDPVIELPGPAAFQRGAELVPAIEQPGTADRVGLQPVDQGHRVVGIAGIPREGPGPLQQSQPQRDDLLGLLCHAIGGGDLGIGHRRIDRALGPVELPRHPDGMSHQEAFDVIARVDSRVQPSSRTWNASTSSPGRMSDFARRPCLTALNRVRSLPSGVLGPVDF